MSKRRLDEYSSCQNVKPTYEDNFTKVGNKKTKTQNHVKTKDKESLMDLSINENGSVNSKAKKVRIPPIKIIAPENWQMFISIKYA